MDDIEINNLKMAFRNPYPIQRDILMYGREMLEESPFFTVVRNVYIKMGKRGTAYDYEITKRGNLRRLIYISLDNEFDLNYLFPFPLRMRLLV